RSRSSRNKGQRAKGTGQRDAKGTGKRVRTEGGRPHRLRLGAAITLVDVVTALGFLKQEVARGAAEEPTFLFPYPFPCSLCVSLPFALGPFPLEGRISSPWTPSPPIAPFRTTWRRRSVCSGRF